MKITLLKIKLWQLFVEKIKCNSIERHHFWKINNWKPRKLKRIKKFANYSNRI